jgi:hypothetical protein
VAAPVCSTLNVVGRLSVALIIIADIAEGRFAATAIFATCGFHDKIISKTSIDFCGKKIVSFIILYSFDYYESSAAIFAGTDEILAQFTHTNLIIHHGVNRRGEA